jgi:hypothetical protein
MKTVTAKTSQGSESARAEMSKPRAVFGTPALFFAESGVVPFPKRFHCFAIDQQPFPINRRPGDFPHLRAQVFR